MNMIARFLRKPAPVEHSVQSVRLPRVVFLSGAGLSADSGIPTYRGEGGVYARIEAKDLMTPRTLAENPEALHRQCDDRRLALADVGPNPAHGAISELAARYGDRLTHITQNVDDLCERAGYDGSIHVHGNLTYMRSLADENMRVDISYSRYWDGDEEYAPERGFRFADPNGSLFRPDVVLFGEQTRLYHRMFLVMGALHPDDLMIVIGTSGTMVPVNRWTSNADCRKVLVNLHRSEAIDESRFDTVLRERSSEVAGEVVDIVRRHLG